MRERCWRAFSGSCRGGSCKILKVMLDGDRGRHPPDERGENRWPRKENNQEDCQEALCRGTQGRSEETGGDDGSSRFVQTSGTSPRQKICEAARGGAPEV